MQKSTINAANSNRALIVVNPVQGVKYFYIESINLYIDVEMFNEKIVKKGLNYALNYLETRIKRAFLGDKTA